MFHIVEDNDDIRTILTEVLALMGYESKSFGCPCDYLEYAKSDAFISPYALLSDVQMPKMNGYEMLDQVRQLHPEIRTAIISGFPKYEGEAKVRSCAFLAKPLVIEEFNHVVESFVNCHKKGPNAKAYGCGSSQRHEDFDIEIWQCPHGSRCENC
ncbi:MAG TPA: response regulator [Mariprofundaceae bacterium]|nr:response regulator [Mariprofundaceae bacterium]